MRELTEECHQDEFKRTTYIAQLTPCLFLIDKIWSGARNRLRTRRDNRQRRTAPKPSRRRYGAPPPSSLCRAFTSAKRQALALCSSTSACRGRAGRLAADECPDLLGGRRVRAAAGAADLCAHHPVRFVVEQLDGFRRDRLGEARPGGVVLRLAVEELVAAGATSESDLSSVAPWPAEELETASVARGDPLVTRAKMRAVVYEPSPHSPRQRSTARDPTSPSARRGSGRRWRPSRRIGRA